MTTEYKKLILTYQYRIKDSNDALVRSLLVLSGKVNFIWNFINNSQKQVLDRNNAGYKIKYWLNKNDLHKLTKGSSKLINLPAQSIQAINEEYINKRTTANKPYLKNRTNRKNRNLPWIPFKSQDIKVDNKGTFTLSGLKLKTWYSRNIPTNATITNGSITRDNLGSWFINITFTQMINEQEDLLLTSPGQNKTGIDAGLNPFLTLCIEEPNGSISYKEINPEKHYRKLQEKLAKYQRARRFKKAKVISKKIKNQRKDYLNKLSNNLIKDNTHVIMGIVELKRLISSGLKGHAKAWSDNGLGMLITMLKTKAKKHNMVYEEISEREIKSTQTCSCCGKITGPKGLEGLGVSQWTCVRCGAKHNRNENSAKNHIKSWQKSQREAEEKASKKTHRKGLRTASE